MEKDRTILRELAEKQAEIARLPVQKTTVEMWRRMNRLEHGKPMVWVREIPWPELETEEELQLRTSTPFCRDIESQFLRTFYQWKHIRGDMVVEPKFYCPIEIKDSGFGLQIQEQTILQGPGHISSHHYEPVIKEEGDIKKIKTPEVTVDREVTERNYQTLQNLFGDILEIEKIGRTGFWLAPCDSLAMWWGIQEFLTDLVIRPEMVHKALDRLVQAHFEMLRQYEKLNLLSLNNGNSGVGSGGLGFTELLPQPDFNPNRIRAKDLWGFATAQIFSEVSPEMHLEFALKYELRWLERFGLNYYGCCEQLHRKVEILKQIPNLRRISMSPRANVEEGASALGDKYIFSYKPNPAVLATDAWNPEAIRTELRQTLEILKSHGCITEIIMKDISTIRYQPQRLREWTQIAVEVSEEFA
ncbi:MAG: hypothetical protein V2A65_12065 [Candidatus Omnitrophota bacterium]